MTASLMSEIRSSIEELLTWVVVED